MSSTPRLVALFQKSRRLLNTSRYQRELGEILEQHDSVTPVIAFLPSLDWRRQLFQRPQQLAVALAEQGALVLYMQFFNPKDHVPFESIAKNLILCNVPVRTFNILAQPFVYLLTWNYRQARPLKSPRLVYDYVDELDAFEGDPVKLARAHSRLLHDARIVMATSMPLYNQVSQVRHDALYCPNGVNYDRFAAYQAKTVPEDLVPVLAAGRPVVGYHGALAHWVDYDLLQGLAIKRSDLSIVLIGPDFDGSLPDNLIQLPNVFWLGAKSYEDMPGYIHFMDIGMIPFRINRITHAASPLKLFEYMAAGKPAVVTPMEESMQYPGVLVGDDLESFSAQIDKALKLRKDKKYLSGLDRVARENTWAIRAGQILSAMEQIARVDRIQI